MNNKKIAIIGYGEIGKAIHGLLRVKTDIAVDVWDKKDQENKLSGAVISADVIFICVPSWCARAVLENIKEYLSKEALIICLSKGIDAGTSKTIDAVLEEILGLKQSFAILSGPMLAEELTGGKNGFAVLASKNKKDFSVISDIFSGTNLKIEYSKDMKGVALCGALKNIYALGLGICDGLNLGSNAKGKLAGEAVKEMAEIVKYLGGTKKSVFSAAGVADLIATAFSNFSRNREVGEELGKTGAYCLESEGFKSVNSMAKLLGKKVDKLPFFNALKFVIFENQKPEDIFKDIL